MPVRLTRSGRTATLTLDRPPLNILDIPMLEELATQLEGLRQDPSLHILILEGAGTRAFSAGVAIEDHVPEKLQAMLETFHRALRTLRELPAISLAVVQGHCLGGGMELATCCDLLLASEDAGFGLPEVELGCFPPAAAALYPRRLGVGRSLDLLLTGRRLGGREAHELGLATWIAASEDLQERRRTLLANLNTRSAAVARLIKEAVRQGEQLPFDEALRANEDIYLEKLASTADMQEGLDAFEQRRPAEWKHR
ncbi:MAG: enoyl-CoA hydratase/isomerase family protein [Deltaproteobacteria bacterium]|nr:enoyl-CoA hydratase/isomerase family protein [Deltaproteobacteria bacterium]